MFYYNEAAKIYDFHRQFKRKEMFYLMSQTFIVLNNVYELAAIILTINVMQLKNYKKRSPYEFLVTEVRDSSVSKN